jgi:hypothetical protein
MADRIIDFRAHLQQTKEKAERNSGVADGGAGPHNPDMLSERLAKLEGAFEGLKSSMDSIRWGIAVLSAITLAGFAFFGAQLIRLDSRIDAIPTKLSDEFRAMRAESAAQTSAIANSITAAKQQQPQVILLPAPAPDSSAKK